MSGTTSPGYPSLLGCDACTGLGVIEPTDLITSIQLNFYFVVDKSTFGVDEVSDNSTWSSAFWLFLEGYKPSVVTPSKPNLAGTFTTIPGILFIPGPPIYELGDSGANANLAQRIGFPFDVQFTTSGANSSLGAFPAAGAEAFFSLSATIEIGGSQLPLTPTAEIEPVGGVDPYFTNVNSAQGNAFYLSQDLRVFTITPGTTVGPGGWAPKLGTGGVPDAYTFIGNLITYLNQQEGYLNASFSPPTDPSAPDPLDTILPLQTGALTGDSSVTPGTSSAPNYNFAIARVRLKGAAGTTTSPGLSVFFRLFSTQTNDTDFIDTPATAAAFDSPNVTYPTSTKGVPSAGTDLSETVINGCTLPFFATANYNAHPTDYNTGGPNNQVVAIPSGQNYVWAFFGCFLNVDDEGNIIGTQTIQQWLAAGPTIAWWRRSPMPTPHHRLGGVVANPENNDKLAQRNLQVTASGNPGFPRPSTCGRVRLGVSPQAA
jgi:hypothetical protein